MPMVYTRRQTALPTALLGIGPFLCPNCAPRPSWPPASAHIWVARPGLTVDVDVGKLLAVLDERADLLAPVGALLRSLFRLGTAERLERWVRDGGPQSSRANSWRYSCGTN